MSFQRFVRALLFMSVLTFGFGLAGPASAQTAEELRRDGKACEQPDGYMRALSAEAQQAVQRINEQRLKFYEERGRKEGVLAAAAGAVYAQQIRSQPHYRPC